MPKNRRHCDALLVGGAFDQCLVPAGSYTSRLTIVDNGGMEAAYYRTEDRTPEGHVVFREVPACSIH